MRKKTGFNLRSVCGENILVAVGKENIDFSELISLNESAALLWRSLGDSDFTLDDMADILLENYEIDRQTALDDSAVLANQWIAAKIVEE